jgi:hypothetical protein
MKIGSWKKTENQEKYIVWSQPRKPNYNTTSVVVKTEMGKWLCFLSVGSAGTRTLNEGGTKEHNIKIAHTYMKMHPY